LLLLYGFGKTSDNPFIEKNNIIIRMIAINIIISISGEIFHPLFFSLCMGKGLVFMYISFSVIGPFGII